MQHRGAENLESYKDIQEEMRCLIKQSKDTAQGTLTKKRKKKSRWKIVFLFVLCIAAGLLLFRLMPHVQNIADAIRPGEGTSGTTEDADDLIPAEVVYVVDGDTLDVLIGSEKVRVRLIGIDTPESSHPDKEENSPEGDQAEAFLSSCIPPGTQVYLEKDISDTDRYGRRLYYVWLAMPQEEMSLTQIQEHMLNAKLVREGYAQAMEVPPDTGYSEIFSRLEENARSEQAGLWKTDCWE